MICLLCAQSIPITYKFQDLFLFQTPEIQLCSSCHAQFEHISHSHCPRCFKSGSNGICMDCQNWESKGVIVSHHAFYCYNDAMKSYFSQYKFQGDYRLRKVFRNVFKKLPQNFVYVPIPVSIERLKERGFNQVTGFLSEIAYQEVLEKEETTQQSSLSRALRLKSENPFRIKKEAHLPQKICLIDDIYTTGATLNHAVKLLKDAGVSEVRTCSLCR